MLFSLCVTGSLKGRLEAALAASSGMYVTLEQSGVGCLGNLLRRLSEFLLRVLQNFQGRKEEGSPPP